MVFCKDCIKLESCNKECVCCSDGIPKDKNKDNKSTKENHSKEDKKLND